MKTNMKINLALLLLVCGASLSAQEEWTTDALPGAISEHSMIRDVANDRLVLFGGYFDGVLTNDVRVYYPARGEWQKLKVEGDAPSPRRESLAAYDAKRNRMIVFGGQSASGNTNDAFALVLKDGAERWVELATDSRFLPPARTHGNLIVDALHDRAILYGGYSHPTVYRDTWSLSLEPEKEQWEELATTYNPTGISVGNAAIYDPIGQRMVVYRPYLLQLVSLSLDADLMWTNHTNATMPQEHRRYPAAAYDSARHEMILQGGLSSSSTLSETLRIDLETMDFAHLPAEVDSTGRFWHTAAYDEVRDRINIVGGRNFPRYAYATMATLGRLPEAPSELRPADGEEITGETVELAWKPAVGIGDGTYVVDVYTEDGTLLGPEHELTISGNRATFFPKTNEGDAATFFWQVMAINANGASEFSQLSTLTHRNEVPPPADDLIGSIGGSDDMADTSLAAPAGATVEVQTTQVIGGGSGDEPTRNAGCTTTGNGYGITLLALLFGLAGFALRRAKRA